MRVNKNLFTKSSLNLTGEYFVSPKSLTKIDEHIKTSPWIEELVLPPIKQCNLTLVLKYLNKLTKYNTSLTSIKSDFDKVCLRYRDERYYKHILSRLERNREKIFGIHGGGNIGLGLMADLIHKSPIPYKIISTTRDMFISHIINTNHQFYIQHHHKNSSDQTRITNVHMVNARMRQNIIDLYVRSNYLAIALTESAFINNAHWIAQGLIARYRHDKAYLKIFVLMNKSNAHKYVADIIKKHVYLLINNVRIAERILQHVEFVPTMIDRIISKIDRRRVINNLKAELCLPKREVISIFPKLGKIKKSSRLKVSLFRAEKKATLYLPESVKEPFLLPSAVRVNNIDRWMELKNKYFNGPHAILAWSGALLGYETIGEAINHPGLLRYIKKLMKEEITPILRAEYPDITKDELNLIESSFINRCRQNRQDKIKRVGRDPLRKLNQGGCIRGVIELCRKNHLSVSTKRLERGIAAGVLYGVKCLDSDNPECRYMKELYKKNQSYQAVLCHQGKQTFSGLHPVNDKKLVENIMTEILALEMNIAYNKNYLVFN